MTYWGLEWASQTFKVKACWMCNWILIQYFQPCIYIVSRCGAGIDKPQSGFTPSAKIRETGRRLARLAECKGVPFEYHAIAEKWEAITPAHLMLREDEVLAVNCMFRLRHTLDETVTAASPRETLLNRIRSMNPKVCLLASLKIFNYGKQE
jgi:hypothetical protein